MKGRLERWTVFGLCVASAWFFARAAVLLVGPQANVFLPRGPVDAPALTAIDTPGYEAVMRRNLWRALPEPPKGMRAAQMVGYNRTEAAPAEEPPDTEELPASRQGWTLLGTVAARQDHGQNRAFLLVDGKQQIVSVSGRIGDWTILHIGRRTVVLEKDDRRERLIMASRNPGEVQTASSGGRIQLARRELEAQLRNVPALMRQIRLTPGQENGVRGLQVTGLEAGGLFARLGLRRNDLLVRANGQPLTNPGDLVTLSQILNQDTFRLEILRNGTTTLMEYDIRR